MTARGVERVNAARGAEPVNGNSSVKSVLGERGLAAKPEEVWRDDQMQESFLEADAAVAFDNLRRVCVPIDLELNGATVATSVCCLHHVGDLLCVFP